MHDELGDRKVLASGYDFVAVRHGPDQKHKLYQELPDLALAAARACDLYADGDRVIGLVEGELRVAGSALLGEMIGRSLVRKGLRNAGTAEQPVFEHEYRSVAVSEANLRLLLTTDEKYSIIKFLPSLTAADITPRGAEPPVVETPPEPATSSDPKTQRELDRGAEAVAKHRMRGAA
jgi:hypothetical protein